MVRLPRGAIKTSGMCMPSKPAACNATDDGVTIVAPTGESKFDAQGSAFRIVRRIL